MAWMTNLSMLNVVTKASFINPGYWVVSHGNIRK